MCYFLILYNNLSIIGYKHGHVSCHSIVLSHLLRNAFHAIYQFSPILENASPRLSSPSRIRYTPIINVMESRL